MPALVPLDSLTGSHADLSYFHTDADGITDFAGHIRQELDSANGLHTFGYNLRYELTGESFPGSPGHTLTNLYTYDRNGNRLQKSVLDNQVLSYTDYSNVDANNKLNWVNRNSSTPPTAGQGTPYTLFGYDFNGRVLTRDRYDGIGRHVFAFGWDGDDRMRAVTEGGASRLTGTYDADGVRLNKWDYWTGTHGDGCLISLSPPIPSSPLLARHPGTTAARRSWGGWVGRAAREARAEVALAR